MLASDFAMPLFRVTPSSWMPSGAKDVTPTLIRIHTLVDKGDVGFVHLDEIDKVYESNVSEWNRCIRNEIYDLMDGTLIATHNGISWSPKLLKKLRRNFMIIGSGTWQNVWDQPAKASLGFHPATDNPSDTVDRIRASGQIPTELLRRFGTLILIPPATEDDYRKAAQDFGLVDLATKLGISLDYREAAISQRGGRWFEETFTQLLLAAKKQNRSDIIPSRNPYPIEEPMEQQETGLEFDSDDPVL
jgi:hypothetical protein